MIRLTPMYCLAHAPISCFIEEHLGKWPGTRWFLQKRHSRSSHLLLASSRAPETQVGRGLKFAYLAAVLSHTIPFLKAPQPLSESAQMCIHHTPGSGTVTQGKIYRSPKTKPLSRGLLKSKLRENKGLRLRNFKPGKKAWRCWGFSLPSKSFPW